MLYVYASLVAGFVGDWLLQRLEPERYGLAEYFLQHGPMESLFVAAGMMGVFSLIFVALFGEPAINQLLLLFLYGGVLDLIFRYGRLFSSLDGYYQALSPPISFLWGGLPFLIAFVLSTLL